MANQNAPMGAVVVGHLNGSPWNGKVRAYAVDAADATALFPGDLVALTGAGVEPNQYGLELPIVTRAAAGVTPVGVVIGVMVNPNNLSQAYRPASTLSTVFVCDSSDVIVEIQSTGTVVAGAVNQLIDVTYATAGSTVWNTSGMQADYTTLGTGTVLSIIGIVQRVNNTLGQYCKLLCKFAKHSYK